MRNPSTETEAGGSGVQDQPKLKKESEDSIRSYLYPIYKGNVTYTLKAELVRKNRVTITS